MFQLEIYRQRIPEVVLIKYSSSIPSHTNLHNETIVGHAGVILVPHVHIVPFTV